MCVCVFVHVSLQASQLRLPSPSQLPCFGIGMNHAKNNIDLYIYIYHVFLAEEILKTGINFDPKQRNVSVSHSHGLS